MRALGDTIAQELASPIGRSLQERLLEAMFLMERFRGVDAGWRDLPQVGEADVSADAIARLAQALRIFIQSYRDHPDVGSAIWALGGLRADEDARLFEAILRDDSEYGSFAREQAQCALEVIRPAPWPPPEHISAQIRSYISENVLPALPAEIRLVSFEVVSWLVRVHMYQHEVFSDRSLDALERHIEGIAKALRSRPGEPWQAVPAYHRRDSKVPFDPEGEVVYVA